VLVPPAMAGILSSPTNRVQGFLGAGHVCAVMGYADYEPLAERFRVPIVVTGFEPLDLLEGIYRCVHMLEEGRVGVENQYVRAVRREGNAHARRIVEQVFQITDRRWRGIGMLAQSGLELTADYADFDARRRFALKESNVTESCVCISGAILQGLKKPHDCPAFGKSCTPETPLGATMVSSEGTCAAYYQYRNNFGEASQSGQPVQRPAHVAVATNLPATVRACPGGAVTGELPQRNDRPA
jgi:hydrogenase expression/formation protein HypD